MHVVLHVRAIHRKAWAALWGAVRRIGAQTAAGERKDRAYFVVVGWYARRRTTGSGAGLGSTQARCDVVLGGNAHQYAARSIAELNAIPYVNALYAPVALPSPDHAPPPAAGQLWDSGQPAENERQWNDNTTAWNARALERINHNRGRLGLKPIDDVYRHILTDHPWLEGHAG
jgi:hypothetical protein